MNDKKLILAAISIPAKSLIESALADDYDASFFVDLDLAQRAVDKQKYDLIMCNAHFSESHSLEFLEYVRSSPLNANTPFLLIRVLDTRFKREITNTIGIAAKELGADRFLDIAELLREKKLEKPVALLKTSIVQLLEDCKNKKNRDVRISSDWKAPIDRGKTP